jgi:hypothetical protein
MTLVAGCGSSASKSPDLAPAMCTLDRVRDPSTMECLPKAGALCGPCGADCPGICVMDGCATVCDDSKVFCPIGYRCDTGHCVSALDAGCHGCYSASDCKTGEVCNLNNKQCVPAPSGADARLEMLALDFVFDNMGTMTRSRNLTYTLGFFSTRDPAFDPFALKPGACGSERSTLTENAPFPVGPLKDAGAQLALMLPAKSIVFSRTKDANPNFGFDYSGSGLMVADFSAGAASWSGSGGADVGAFTAAGTIPGDFTTTPDVLANPSMSGDVTIQFSAGAKEGAWLEISWNEISGNTVTSLTRVACRASDGATSVTIPAAQVMSAPKNQQLNLFATRASVVEFTTSGVMQGRATFGVQKAGAITLQ